MRLIDADKLTENRYLYQGDCVVGERSYITFQEIDEAPTVEVKADHKVQIVDKDHIWVDGNQYISLRRFGEAVNEAKSVPAEIIHCKDCIYFERDHLSNVNGFPIITCHNICTKWNGRDGGCVTREEGYCFLAERRWTNDTT